MTWVEGMSEEQVTEFKSILQTTLDCAHRIRELGTAVRMQLPSDPDAGLDLWSAANHLMDGSVLLFVVLHQIDDLRIDNAEMAAEQ